MRKCVEEKIIVADSPEPGESLVKRSRVTGARSDRESLDQRLDAGLRACC
jgi:hypothetical protein